MSKEKNILKSALESFVQKGFHGSSTSSIAENAGVSNGTLFHYFKTKEVLVQHLHQSIKSEQIEYLSKGFENENDPKGLIHLIWKNLLDWSMNNVDKRKFLYQYKFSPYKKKHKSDVSNFKKEFSEIIEKGIQLKQIRFMPPELIFESLNGNVYGLTEYLLQNPVKYRTPEFIKQSFEMFWCSIKA